MNHRGARGDNNLRSKGNKQVQRNKLIQEAIARLVCLQARTMLDKNDACGLQCTLKSGVEVEGEEETPASERFAQYMEEGRIVGL